MSAILDKESSVFISSSFRFLEKVLRNKVKDQSQNEQMSSLFQVLMLPVQAAAERAAKCYLQATLTTTLVEAQSRL